MAETDRAHGRGAPVAYLPQVRRPVARRTGWAAGSIGRAGQEPEQAKSVGLSTISCRGHARSLGASGRRITHVQRDDGEQRPAACRCVARRRIAFVLKRTRGAPRWGRDQALLSSLGESEDWGCVWAASSAPGWRLSDFCERDQRELAGVVCFGDHVGHCEVGADR